MSTGRKPRRPQAPADQVAAALKSCALLMAELGVPCASSVNALRAAYMQLREHCRGMHREGCPPHEEWAWAEQMPLPWSDVGADELRARHQAASDAATTDH